MERIPRQKNFRWSIIIFVSLTIMGIMLVLIQQKHEKTNKQFQMFIHTIDQQALQLGIHQRTLDRYLNHLKAPKAKPLVFLHHQPQRELTFADYYNRLVTRKKMEIALSQWEKYDKWFEIINQRYHVQAPYILAMWGIESNFGETQGRFPIIENLATLAYQHHRSTFYRYQLLMALKMLDKPNIIPEQLKSSWDGGMGQPQFMPDTYFHYAVDIEKTGFKNIWTNVPDVLASIANFLHQNDWNGQDSWGISVLIPKNLPEHFFGLDRKLTLDRWQSLGVRLPNHTNLPSNTKMASLIRLDKSGQHSFLVFDNFHVLLRWNNIPYEAACIGLFAQQLNDLHSKKKT